MPFIGNTPQTQSFAPAVDYFSGNGVTVTFTLSRPVVSVAQLTVAVDNVIQNPSSAFTVSGNSITFTSAPLSGTNNIWVEYTSLITTYAAISQDPSVIGDITATGGFLAEGDFGNSYIDGTIVDYVTGNARITTGPIDDMTFYHGGTSGRSEMMRLSYAGTNSYIVGNFGVGTTSPSNRLSVVTAAGSDGFISVSSPTTDTAGVSINGGTSSNKGAIVRFQKDASTKWTMGTDSAIIGSTSDNFHLYGGGANSILFSTNATERMRIDSSGRVTTPSQPGIAINNIAQVFSATPGFFKPTTYSTSYNVGGGFNATGGPSSSFRYTAPVAGVYFINWSVMGDNGGIRMETSIQKNGTGFVGGDVNTGSYACAVISTFQYLAANDYLDFRLNEGGIWASQNPNCYLSVYLVG